MKFSEKKLLDNLTGISNCGDFMSTINKVVYYWNYGYRNDGWHPCDRRDDAEEIKITEIFGYNLKIIPLPKRCMSKTKFQRAETMYSEWLKDLES